MKKLSLMFVFVMMFTMTGNVFAQKHVDQVTDACSGGKLDTPECHKQQKDAKAKAKNAAKKNKPTKAKIDKKAAALKNALSH